MCDQRGSWHGMKIDELTDKSGTQNDGPLSTEPLRVVSSIQQLKQMREQRWHGVSTLMDTFSGFSILLALMIFTTIFSPTTAQGHPINMDAIAQIESSNNPKAVSKDGSVGLYQITPICLKHFNQVNGPQFYIGLGEVESGSGFLEAKYRDYKADDLKDKKINSRIANWYMNWLYDRCWTVKDTLIAWNWGIGNWREWRNTNNPEIHNLTSAILGKAQISRDDYLPKITQDYLKKYEKLTGESLQ